MDIIQFSDITRCAYCVKPIIGAEIHPECQEGYEQYWREREAEMQYRASTGNDPRVRTTQVLNVPSITDIKGFNDIVEAMNKLADEGASSGKCPTINTRSVYSELKSIGDRFPKRV